jgi:hypothetical protein
VHFLPAESFATVTRTADIRQSCETYRQAVVKETAINAAFACGMQWKILISDA